MTLTGLGHTELGPSKLSLTGRPTTLRHWVAYHSPDVMGYEFFECEGFSVLTNKRVRSIVGDVVWVIGRLGGTKRFFLDSRFRVSTFANTNGHPAFDYIVSGQDGIVFFPTPEVTRASWFRQLMTITSDLSVGLQAIYDPQVIGGLKREYRNTLVVQGSSL